MMYSFIKLTLRNQHFERRNFSNSVLTVTPTVKMQILEQCLRETVSFQIVSSLQAKSEFYFVYLDNYAL